MSEVSHSPPSSTGVDNLKLAMWLVIGSECVLFATLIVNYVIQVLYLARRPTVDGIVPETIIDVPITSASTFVLLMSSVAMVLCLRAIEEDDIARFRRWCFITAGLGAVFLGFQIYEFTYFYLAGLGFATNNFGAAFFALTGTHGAHVLVGIIILSTVGLWSYQGKMKSSKHAGVVEAIGLYWHFVDVIWILIFTVVYLFVLAP